MQSRIYYIKTKIVIGKSLPIVISLNYSELLALLVSIKSFHRQFRYCLALHSHCHLQFPLHKQVKVQSTLLEGIQSNRFIDGSVPSATNGMNDVAISNRNNVAIRCNLENRADFQFVVGAFSQPATALYFIIGFAYETVCV